MRPFVSLLLFASVNTGLCAQPAERIYDLGKDGLKLERRIDAGDPKVKVHVEGDKSVELSAKSFLVRLAGGKSYRVTMESRELDSFLIVQDNDGKQLDYDDDSGGGQDAALTLAVANDRTYRFFAASLKNTGTFIFRLRERATTDPPPLSQEDRGQVEEAMRFHKEAIRLYERFDLQKAIESTRKALAIRRKVLGEKHVATAQSLEMLAGYLLNQGNYRESREAYENSLTIRKSVLGEQHIDTARSMSGLGALFYSRGQHDAARSHLERALAIKREILGDEHTEIATSHYALGTLLRAQGDYSGARLHLEKALAIQRKLLGVQHRDTALSLNNLGSLLRAQGDYAAAQAHFEQALAIYKKVLGDQHPITAGTLNNLGGLLQDQGDYAAARSYYERALAIHKKVLGEQHRNTAVSLNNIGNLLQNQGDYAAARPYYEQALSIETKVLGDQHVSTASTRNNLGTLLQAQGDFAAARHHYLQVLAIRKKILGEQHPHTATSLNSLGALLVDQGDYAAARPYFEQALAIRKKVLGEQHPDIANSLNNLGTLLHSQEDYAAARPYYEQALAIRKKVLGEQHPDIPRSLYNLGRLLQDEGDYAAALPFYEQALSICKKVLGEQHPDTARSLNGIGNLYWAQGSFAAARPYYEQALAIEKKVLGEQHPDTAGTLNNLGFLLHAQGHYDPASSYYEQALAIHRRSLDLAATALSERQQLAMEQRNRFCLDTMLSLPFDEPTRSTVVARAYDAVLGRKGAVSFRQHQLRLLRRDPSLAPKAAELQAITARLANLTNAMPNPKKADEHRKLLVKLTQDREELEVELARLGADFRAEQNQARSSGEALAKALPSNTALVDFVEYRYYQPGTKRKAGFLFERRLTVFVLRNEMPVVRVELGPAKAITQVVELWRQAVVRKQALAASEEGRKLRQLLWAPLEKHLGGAKTVLIAPDGATARVPFAALPGHDPEKYLLEEVALATFPYPRRLLSLPGPRSDGGPDSLLLVGDIDYGAVPGKSEQVAALTAPRSGERGFHFRPLENTRGEILALRDTFERRFKKGKTTLLRDDEATEAALRKEAPNHRWLHIATHGFFAPPEIKSAAAPDERHDASDLFGKGGVVGFHPGLLSGIALAGANRPPEPGQDDGILTAMEVEELHLRKTQLVVLSACETGLGKVAGGEGVLGLQRAFQIAGARTTITSLWKVDDAATRRLMERFYENYWRKNMGTLEALRSAQLDMLRGELPRAAERDDGPTDRRAPPYYWAAFVLSGDWR
jgi:CHAT domain-containing protein/Tfp pilus assembly protein PilF